MCPSYRATREERDSPRGRSHLLFEMLSGQVVKGGWRSNAVRDALDLCLGCKGCKRDCPVNVDIGSYKTEFLQHYYSWRPRPLSHYSMGYLPMWLRVGAKAPSVVNTLMQSRPSAMIKHFGGIAPEHGAPSAGISHFSEAGPPRGLICRLDDVRSTDTAVARHVHQLL